MSQHAVAGGALAVAPGHGLAPVGRAQRLRQHGLDAGDELLGALDQVGEFIVHFRLYLASILRYQLLIK